MIKIRLKITVDINLPMDYASNATLDTIKAGVKGTVQDKVQALFVGQDDFTPVPPLELVLLNLEDTL